MIFNKIMLTLIIVTGILLSACSEEIHEPVVKGRLLGHDGHPMLMAHVHAIIYGKSTDTLMVEVNTDGTFCFPHYNANMIAFEFTGVNHIKFSKNIWNYGIDQDIEIKVCLQGIRLDDSFTQYTLIGDFNDFSFYDNKIPMQRQRNGTYVATVPNASDTINYQVIGADMGTMDRSVNGTQSDGFKYDGNSDYISYIISSEPEVEIVFDPGKVRFEESEPKLKYLSKRFLDQEKVKEELAAHNEITWTVDNPSDKQRAEMSAKTLCFINSLMKSHRCKATQVFLIEEYQTYMSNLLGKEASIECNKKYSYLLLDMFTIKSHYWSTRSWQAAMAHIILNNDYSRGFIDMLTEFHPDIHTRMRTLYYLADLANTAKNKEILKYAMDKLVQKFPGSFYTKDALYKYSEDRAIKEGKQVPDFEFTELNNIRKKYTPKTFKGKFLIMDFWATWCGPCRGEMEFLHQAYNKYRGKLNILSLSYDREPKDINKYRSGRYKMPWAHTWLGEEIRSDISERFEVMGIPKPILIGPNGVIIATGRELRGSNLDATLYKYIGE